MEPLSAIAEHMIRSAQTRRWLLERCARLSPDQVPDVAVASNTRGLFAACLARQWGLATSRPAATSLAQMKKYALFQATTFPAQAL